MSMIKVVHIMADGEIRDSIEGITPPASCGCWAVMREIEKRRQKDDKAGTRGQPEAAAGSGERRNWRSTPQRSSTSAPEKGGSEDEQPSEGNR